MDKFCQLHEENLNLKLTGIAARLEAIQELNALNMQHQVDKLEEIHKQTLLTNGRVNALEKQTNFWRWLTDKPIRLIASIVAIIAVSKLITNDQIIEFIFKIFS